jgi:hyperosmotically inducible protein
MAGSKAICVGFPSVNSFSSIDIIGRIITKPEKMASPQMVYCKAWARSETAIQANPKLTASGVTVEKGVATLSGQVPDEATKEELGKAAAAVPGVTSVVNNLTIAITNVEIAADSPLAIAVKDATKDFPTVTATVADGIVTLKGELQKANLQKLMMALNALKPKKVDNQLVIK